MLLKLALEHAPHRQSIAEISHESGELTIGRGAECSWQIEDPDMFVSRTHCVIQGDRGQFTVTDASRGGLFIDGREEPLGPGNTATLEHGTRLRLGDFVIRVTLAAEDARNDVRPPAATETPVRTSGAADPFGAEDVFARRPSDPAVARPSDDLADPFGSTRETSGFGAGPSGKATERLHDPFAFDATESASPGRDAGAGYLSPGSEPDFGSFLDETSESSNASSVVDSGFGGFLSDSASGFHAPADDVPGFDDFDDISHDAPPVPVTDPLAVDLDFSDLGGPAATDPQALPGADPGLEGFGGDAPDRAPAAPPVKLSTAAPGPGAAWTAPPGPSAVGVPVPPPAPAVVPPAQTGVHDAALRAAFFKGLGLDPARFKGGDDPEAEMEALGKRFRLLVDGLMHLLRSRAQEKQNVRVAQTLIGNADVNPLKFLATTEDALASLVEPRGAGYLAPDDAINGAFRDLADHRLRTWTALQSSLRNMIDRFDPAEIEREIESTGKLQALISGGRRARLWQLYNDRYKEIAKSAEDRFLGDIGADFRDAYEGKRRKGND